MRVLVRAIETKLDLSLASEINCGRVIGLPFSTRTVCHPDGVGIKPSCPSISRKTGLTSGWPRYAKFRTNSTSLGAVSRARAKCKLSSSPTQSLIFLAIALRAYHSPPTSKPPARTSRGCQDGCQIWVDERLGYEKALTSLARPEGFEPPTL
jgi:hypothetical protein